MAQSLDHLGQPFALKSESRCDSPQTVLFHIESIRD